MPAPSSLSADRTGTPDGSLGIQLADVASQEDGNKKIVSGLSLSDRIASGISADRSNLAAIDSNTDMSTADFAGAAGANLLAVNNRGALAVWCNFYNAAGSAVVEIIFYDSANNPLFISEQLAFTAKTRRLSSIGNYMSQVQIIDTCGASKYRPLLKTIGTGNVDIYAHPL